MNTINIFNFNPPSISNKIKQIIILPRWEIFFYKKQILIQRIRGKYWFGLNGLIDLCFWVSSTLTTKFFNTVEAN